ncbi:hypothetical protein [Deinococcus sp. YIM 77859]|uniref:hypothetical protein n=1 Tax=Deinococcus sp. YIM 77859 TaxID=1540221 RepID=UPI00054E9FE9|nr:hypothetical protein [Deinococcus sp. YIM 77859]
MRSHGPHRVLLVAALLPGLTGCAFGAYIAANTPLERAINGTYEGIGVGGTGRVPYRLILYVQEREGRASGVITNLESRKAYAVSGKFQRAGEGGTLDVNLYEDGDKWRGTLRGEIAGTKLSGTLRTVLLGRELLGYVVNLEKQPEGNPPVRVPAPTVP